AGGASRGRTTLVNALLAEVAKTTDPHRPHRGYAEASVLRSQPGGTAHKGRCRLAVRSRPLVAATAPGPASRSARCAALRRLTCSRPWGTGHPDAAATSLSASSLAMSRGPFG